MGRRDASGRPAGGAVTLTSRELRGPAPATEATGKWWSSRRAGYFLARARDAGYFTRVFFIGTNSPTINAARVAARVIQGGHTVPIGKIISRYERSTANLSAAIALADRTYIYDNSVDDVEAVLCARTADGLLRKVYCSLPAWVAGAVGNVEHHAAFDDVSLVASSEPP